MKFQYIVLSKKYSSKALDISFGDSSIVNLLSMLVKLVMVYKKMLVLSLNVFHHFISK